MWDRRSRRRSAFRGDGPGVDGSEGHKSGRVSGVSLDRPGRIATLAAMYEYAEAAVEGALAAGATYADARVVVSKQEGIDVQNQAVQSLDRSEQAGVGVRALFGSSWGFFATADLTRRSAAAAGERAAEIARASAVVPGDPVQFADVDVVQATYETPYVEHPFAVSMSEKVDLLVDVTKTMQEVDGIAIATGNLTFYDTNKWFVSSQGHRIDQHIVESGGGFDATALGERESQRRSYPQSFGQYETGGYETVRKWDYAGNAGRIAEEAAALLVGGRAGGAGGRPHPGGSQLALQIHESVGHAIELDRILGWEAAFAGTSHLELPNLGTFRVRLRPHEHHGGCHVARSTRHLRIRRRGHTGTAGRHCEERDLARRTLRP